MGKVKTIVFGPFKLTAMTVKTIYRTIRFISTLLTVLFWILIAILVFLAYDNRKHFVDAYENINKILDQVLSSRVKLNEIGKVVGEIKDETVG